MLVNALQAYDTSAIVRLEIANTILSENHTAGKKVLLRPTGLSGKTERGHRLKAGRFIEIELSKSPPDFDFNHTTKSSRCRLKRRVLDPSSKQ